MPKGPSRTENTMMIAKIMNYYAAVFSLRPPDLPRRGPFSERENVCNSQENGVRTRCAAIVNHGAIAKILRKVNLLRVVFLVRLGRIGPSGMLEGPMVVNVSEAPCTEPFLRHAASRKIPAISGSDGTKKASIICLVQDKFDHDKGQKSAISGRRLHWGLSTGFFASSPVFMCNLARRAP